METKNCSKCGRELPKSEFYRNANAKDGLQFFCKECTKEAVERYLRWYFRYYKQRNQFHTTNLVETSWNWGRFRVEDTRGYVRYFM